MKDVDYEMDHTERIDNCKWQIVQDMTFDFLKKMDEYNSAVEELMELESRSPKICLIIEPTEHDVTEEIVFTVA